MTWLVNILIFKKGFQKLLCQLLMALLGTFFNPHSQSGIWAATGVGVVAHGGEIYNNQLWKLVQTKQTLYSKFDLLTLFICLHKIVHSKGLLERWSVDCGCISTKNRSSKNRAIAHWQTQSWEIPNPRILNPAILNPGILNPGILNPWIFHPRVQGPIACACDHRGDRRAVFGCGGGHRGGGDGNIVLVVNSRP